VVYVQGNKPRRFSRSRSVWVAKSWTWNYAREVQSDNVNAQVNNTFMNYWGVGRQLRHRPAGLDDRLTRGGPSATIPRGGFVNSSATPTRDAGCRSRQLQPELERIRRLEPQRLALVQPQAVAAPHGVHRPAVERRRAHRAST
jgi:hypothetical protein